MVMNRDRRAIVLRVFLFRDSSSYFTLNFARLSSIIFSLKVKLTSVETMGLSFNGREYMFGTIFAIL